MHERARALWRRVVVAADEAEASGWYNLANAAACTGNVDAALNAYAHSLVAPAGARLRQAAWSNAAALCIRARKPSAAAACGCAALAAGLAAGARMPAHVLYNLNTALRQTGDQARAVRASWRHVAARATPAAPRLASFAAAQAAGGVPLAPSHTQPRQLPPRIVCVKWGSKYDAAYANRLGRAVGRHLPGVARVVCYTDDTAGLDAKDIEARPLPRDTALEAWWLKAFLFSSAAGLEGPVLYLDLDTVICGPLSALVARAVATGPGGLALLGTDELENENRAGGYNSSVMAWNAPAHGQVWDLLANEPAAYQALAGVVYKFDHWLEMLVGNADILQNILPGVIIEYRRDVLTNAEEPPPAASIVCFPLDPKPHDVHTPWLDRHWH